MVTAQQLCQIVEHIAVGSRQLVLEPRDMLQQQWESRSVLRAQTDVNVKYARKSQKTEKVDIQQGLDLVDRHQACYDGFWPLDLEGHESKNDLKVTNEDFGALQGHFEEIGIEDFLCIAHFLSHPLEIDRSEAFRKLRERHDVDPSYHVEH